MRIELTSSAWKAEVIAVIRYQRYKDSTRIITGCQVQFLISTGYVPISPILGGKHGNRTHIMNAVSILNLARLGDHFYDASNP